MSAGIVVADRYELAEVIGTGGQATVYRARDRHTKKLVAVKMLSASLAEDPQHAARLAREQSALVALAGTSAVAVYDLCRAPDGSFCLVMELLEGTDLEHHFGELEARGEHLSLARLSAITEPLVDTLERAHDAEIIHRDIKPGNIFILSNPGASGGGVRLLDFGLSWVKTATRLTVAGTVLGSPSYIAPEVWRGRTDELDTRVDVYSLGVILFRALTGALPFEAKALAEAEQTSELVAMLKLVTTAPRPSLHALRPDLPSAVDEWTERALAVDRKERYQTVRELWNGLLRALHYAPPLRSQRPVAESFVSAWRAATSAFRRFIDGDASSEPGPRPSGAPPIPTIAPTSRAAPPEAPPETRLEHEEWISAPADDQWVELGDSDLEAPSEKSRPVKPAEHTSDRPSAGPATTTVAAAASLVPASSRLVRQRVSSRPAPAPVEPAPVEVPPPVEAPTPEAPSVPDETADKSKGRKRTRTKKSRVHTAKTKGVEPPVEAAPAPADADPDGKKKTKRNRRKTR